MNGSVIGTSLYIQIKIKNDAELMTALLKPSQKTNCK